MKKYIKKIIKRFLFFAIIFVIITNSYATSTIDASNFVSNSEFASALADFNSRLTAFEAGINSKIDTQVSSYLDRNGIWSKKEQVLKNHKYKLGGNSEESWTLVSQWNTRPINAWPERVICEKLDKSGLAFIYYTIDAKHSGVASAANGFHIYNSISRSSTMTASEVSVGNYFRVIARSKFKCWYSFQQKDEYNNYVGDTVYIWDPIQYSFYPQQAGSNDWTFNTAEQADYIEAWSYKYQKGMVMMFVSRGNSLWTKFAYDYTAGQVSTNYYMELDVSWTDSCNSTTCYDSGTNNYWPVYNSIDSVAIY